MVSILRKHEKQGWKHVELHRWNKKIAGHFKGPQREFKHGDLGKDKSRQKQNQKVRVGSKTRPV